MTKPSHDYAKLDQTYNFKWKAERIELARKAGYSHISEHIIETYRKTKSQHQTGKLCGNLTECSVRYFLVFAGEPRNGRGGANYSPKVFVEIHGKPTSLAEVAKMTGCSYESIRLRHWRKWSLDEILIPKRLKPFERINAAMDLPPVRI